MYRKGNADTVAARKRAWYWQTVSTDVIRWGFLLMSVLMVSLDRDRADSREGLVVGVQERQ